MTARIRQTTPLVLNVDPGHIQEAVNALVYDYDFALGAKATIQLSANEYHDQVTIASEITPHVFVIRGASAAHPESTLWAVPNPTPYCLVNATDGGRAVLADLSLGSYCPGSLLLAAFQEGTFDLANVIFGSCEGGVMMKTGRGGRINFTGAIKINGNANAFAQADGGTIEMSGVDISFLAAQSFTQFVVAEFGGAITRSAGFSGYAASGKQYTISPGGILRKGNVTMPGNQAGTCHPQGIVY